MYITPKQLKKYRENKQLSWEEMYSLAKNYYDFYHNLDVPYKFKTKNGYDYNDDGYNLGIWIYEQKNIRELSDERRNKLKKIAMNFELKSKKISEEELYQLAKNYYNHYGNLNIPYNFKTKNGYEYNSEGYNLGMLMYYKKYHKSFNEEMKMKYEQIGYYFTTEDNDKLSWNEMYELAKNYYIHHNNLKIDTRFKTKNGYEYDKDGYNLGIWLDTQKRNKNLSDLRRKKLDVIGIIYNAHENKYKVLLICNKYNIDVTKNKKALESISYQELCLKIWYLINKREKLYNELGILHEIFYLNNNDLNLKYNINLEDIMQQANLKENKKSYQLVLK